RHAHTRLLFSVHIVSIIFFFLLIRPPPISTLFPYTTLFRSRSRTGRCRRARRRRSRTARRSRAARRASRGRGCARRGPSARRRADRKSTRLNSSHVAISYAVFCCKKIKQTKFILQKRRATLY